MLIVIYFNFIYEFINYVLYENGMLNDVLILVLSYII